MYDAFLLHDAMKGLGTKDVQLIGKYKHYLYSNLINIPLSLFPLLEVLVSRHPDHLKKVREFFQNAYGKYVNILLKEIILIYNLPGKSLDEWIAGDTSGDYCQYLLALGSVRYFLVCPIAKAANGSTGHKR